MVAHIPSSIIYWKILGVTKIALRKFSHSYVTAAVSKAVCWHHSDVSDGSGNSTCVNQERGARLYPLSVRREGRHIKRWSKTNVKFGRHKLELGWAGHS